MTAAELTTFVGALGFPIVLVLALMWFVKRDVWPWYMKYMAERAAAQDARHAEYIGSMTRGNEAMEALIGLITKIDSRLEEHTRRLAIIEAAARSAAAMRGS